MATGPNFRAAIFDLDDTLLRSVTQKWAHHRAVAKEIYGFDLTDAELLEHWGKPLDELMANLYHQSDTPENMFDAMISLEPRFQKELFDDAPQGVTDLMDAGIEVGVVTSTNTARAIVDLERFKFPLARMFTIRGHDDCAFHKPDPRVFDEALEQLTQHGIQKEDVAYVGDSLFDMQAAIGAGISFIAVTTGLISRGEFEHAGAQTIADSIKEVVAGILHG